MNTASKTVGRSPSPGLLLHGQTHHRGRYSVVLLLLTLLLGACASAPAARLPSPAITVVPVGNARAATGQSTATVAAPSVMVATLPALPVTEAAQAASSSPSPEIAPLDQQVFRVAWTEPESLDPDHAQTLAASGVLRQLFTGLAALAPDQTYQPAVAESWQFNADQTQLTFRLKATQWSDGRPVTAADFVYAVQRTVDPREASTGAAGYLGLIKGATALNTTPVSATVQLQQALDSFGVKALDAQTLQFTLAQPTSPFHALTMLATTWPLRQDVITQYGDSWTQPGHLIGNGPFVLKSWARGSELNLAPNPHFYDRPPKLSRLSFKFAAAWSNYLANVLEDTAVPPSEIDHVRADPQLKQQLVQLNELGTVMIGFNLMRPPFNNPKGRQAFAAAIDRQSIVHQLLHDVGVAAYSFIPPGMPGHLSEAEAGAAGQRYDPVRAKQLLAEAGYPNGQGFPQIHLTCIGDFCEVMRRAQANMQTTLGVKITLDPRDFKGYYDGPTSIFQQPPDLFFTRLSGDPDTYGWDPIAFGPSAQPTANRWQNTAFTTLIQQAMQERDPNTSLALLKEAEKVVAQDAPRIFLYHLGVMRMVKPYIRGLVVTPWDPTGVESFRQVEVLKH